MLGPIRSLLENPALKSAVCHFYFSIDYNKVKSNLNYIKFMPISSCQKSCRQLKKHIK